MIEELKFLLDQMGNVPDVALWILGGFLAFKLITYLSFTGSVVYVAKLLCDTFIKYKTKPEVVSYGDVCINSSTNRELQKFLTSQVGSGSYLHEYHLDEFKAAWADYKAKSKVKS